MLVPAFKGLAVKLTDVPVHILPAGFAETLIAGGETIFILMMLEEAVVEARQLPPVTAISHVTVLPLVNVALV